MSVCTIRLLMLVPLIIANSSIMSLFTSCLSIPASLSESFLLSLNPIVSIRLSLSFHPVMSEQRETRILTQTKLWTIKQMQDHCHWERQEEKEAGSEEFVLFALSGSHPCLYFCLSFAWMDFRESGLGSWTERERRDDRGWRERKSRDDSKERWENEREKEKQVKKRKRGRRGV